MEKNILLGRGREMLEIPQETWKKDLERALQHSQSRLNFMTDAHHQIRYFVVKEMVIRQKPIEPELISEKLNIPLGEETLLPGSK